MKQLVRLPNDRVVVLDVSKDSDRVETLRENGLDALTDYCNDNWLNSGYGSAHSPERNIRSYLSGCAQYILQGDADGARTARDAHDGAAQEIPISTMPPAMRDKLYGSGEGSDAECRQKGGRVDTSQESYGGGKKKKKRSQPRRKWPPTRFQKIERLKAELGACEFLYCGIDTENHFMVNSESFWLDKSVEAYQPVETAFGTHYAMDQVTVLVDPVTKAIKRFCDQSMDIIPDDMVTRGDGSPAIAPAPEIEVESAVAEETQCPECADNAQQDQDEAPMVEMTEQVEDESASDMQIAAEPGWRQNRRPRQSLVVQRTTRRADANAGDSMRCRHLASGRHSEIPAWAMTGTTHSSVCPVDRAMPP